MKYRVRTAAESKEFEKWEEAERQYVLLQETFMVDLAKRAYVQMDRSEDQFQTYEVIKKYWLKG